ncbi:MAG: VOC family protein [Gammaproteobacteria bacterium]|nr:VOC family protein [Gammaproteobacteria bacterium]
MQFQRVQHVSVARPRGSESASAARKFYGEILGLAEISPPSTLSDLDLIWFRLGDDELHVFPIDGNPVDLGQHFCLQVDDVGRLRARLAENDVRIIDDTAIPNRPRFFCKDPFGNRIECTTILGPYDQS